MPRVFLLVISLAFVPLSAAASEVWGDLDAPGHCIGFTRRALRKAVMEAPRAIDFDPRSALSGLKDLHLFACVTSDPSSELMLVAGALLRRDGSLAGRFEDRWDGPGSNCVTLQFRRPVWVCAPR